MTEYAPSKTAEHLSDNRAVQNYQKFTFCEKDLKDNDINMIASIWREDILECKSLDIVNSKVSQFSSSSVIGKQFRLLGTDKVQRQISEHIFASVEGYYIVYLIHVEVNIYCF